MMMRPMTAVARMDILAQDRPVGRSNRPASWIRFEGRTVTDLTSIGVHGNTK